MGECDQMVQGINIKKIERKPSLNVLPIGLFRKGLIIITSLFFIHNLVPVLLIIKGVFFRKQHPRGTSFHELVLRSFDWFLIKTCGYCTAQYSNDSSLVRRIHLSIDNIKEVIFCK